MNAALKSPPLALINKSLLEQFLSLSDSLNFCDMDRLRIFRKFGGRDADFHPSIPMVKEDLITIRSKEFCFSLSFIHFKNSYRKVMEDLQSQVQTYQDEHNIKLFIKYVFFKNGHSYQMALGTTGYFILQFQPLYCDYQI